MTTISATSVLASRHALDPIKRVDSMLWRYPRWIHAEGRTHRLHSTGEDEFGDWEPRTPSVMEDPNLSRNASSSRAIPAEKLIQDVIDDPAIPLYWGKNQKGMQAYEELTGQARIDAESEWMLAMESAIRHARNLIKFGAHKQLINRLLEPFSHITVVVTATNYSNFLALRDHKHAEPHIQILAQMVREALEGARVQILEPGQWHTPWITAEEQKSVALNSSDIQKLSVARCASTSYKTVEGFDMTLEVAERIWDSLFSSPIHASPFEHQAQADGYDGEWNHGRYRQEHLSGNLGPGWIQLRKTLPGECL